MGTSKKVWDTYLLDESSDEENSDDVTCYQLLRADKRCHEGDRDSSVKRQRDEELELIQPSTSKKDNYLLEGSSDEENNDEVKFYQLPRTEKRSHEEVGDYSVKRKRNEELELIQQPSTSEVVSNTYNCESSAPKKTLHGLTYQLRLLMLFVQRVPDGQEFFLSTEMHEAGLFDDIVLKYLKDGVWRYRFLQAKHKNDDKYKIKELDLFNREKNLKTKSKNESKSSKSTGDSKPYLLKKYFESFCTIKENPFFNDAHFEEFLICTNVGFTEQALSYFECTEENNDDPILGNRMDFEEILDKDISPIKFRLSQEKIPDLKQRFEITSENENYFLSFIMKFRFLALYNDSELNENIQNCLKKCLRVENIDLANAYLQSRVLKWFESYKDNRSEFLLIKDKKEFLNSLNNNIQSLMVAGYSNFYIEELESFGIQFENILPLREFIYQNKDKIKFVITSSPKLSIIKVSQVFNELKLSRDEVILTNAEKLHCNKKIFPTFFLEPSYRWLVIECHNTIQLGKKWLDIILQMDNKKTVIIIGREENILNFNKSSGLKTHFVENNNLFKDLTMNSQKKLLEKQVLFQGKKVTLNQLIDINSGSQIIDEVTLEKLITEHFEIWNNDALISDFLTEDYYIPRRLIKRELELNILQNEELLKACLFFIPGINENQLKNLNIGGKWIFTWEDGKFFKNGIILSERIKSKDIFSELCKNATENVCWLEYLEGKFLIMDVINNTDILHKHNIHLEEHDLDKKQILENNIMIVADGPGSGKSTFMVRVADQLKKIMPNIWVLRMNLSSYTCNQKYGKKALRFLEDIDFKDHETNRAIEFIVDLLFPQEYEKPNTHFVRKLLVNSLYSENKNIKFPTVILLFDGFDEISPKFKEKTPTLLKALRNSNVTQMWISTRNHEQRSLEMALHYSSFFLYPLTFLEKINFFRNYWKYNLLNFDDIKLKTNSEGALMYLTEIEKNISNSNYYCGNVLELLNNPLTTYSYPELRTLLSVIDFYQIAEHLLNYLENCNTEKTSDFTNNPLQLKMAAEIVFLDKFRSLEKLAIYSLFDDFIKYKWMVFCEDKSAVGISYIGSEFFETQLKYLARAHQDIAFQILFPEHDKKQSREINDKIALSRAGLLLLHDGCLEFVHRSFAEYFVSQYFAENFHDKDIQNLLFSLILTKENYSLIRKFLNNNETFQAKLSSKTQQMFDIIKVNNSDLRILYRMGEEGVYNLLVKFLENLPLDFAKDVILFNENDGMNTLLHEICSAQPKEEILENVLEAVKGSVSSEIFEEFLFKKNKEHKTALYWAFINGYPVVERIFKIFELTCGSKLFLELLLQVDENGYTILHTTCQYGYDITHLLKVNDENRETINRLLIKFDNSGRTALFYAVFNYTNSVLITLCNLIKSVCSPKIIEHLFEMDDNSRALVHTVCIRNSGCNNLAGFLDAIKNETEELLFKTDEDRLLPLSFTLLTFKKQQVIKVILDFVKSNYSREMLRTFLLKGYNNGETILHSALLDLDPRFGTRTFTSFLTNLFNLVEDRKELFYELLLKRNNDGRTVLLLCSYYPEPSTRLQELLDFVQRHCSESSLEELLLKLDNNKCSILHCFCRGNSEIGLPLLLNIIKAKTEILNELLFQADIQGETALHYTALYSDSSFMIETLLNFVNILNKTAVLNELILKADHNGQTVLHFCVRSDQKLKFLLDFVKINCDKKTFNKLLFKCDNDGRTGLHIFCQISGNGNILTYFLDSVKDSTTTEAFNIFLLKKDCHGKVASDYIADNNNSIFMSNIFLRYRMQLLSL